MAAYLCLLGPGLAWWRGNPSSLPRTFAAVTLSVAWTSLAGLALSACGRFSLPLLVLLNALVSLLGYMLVGLRSREPDRMVPAAGAGLALALLALCLYWPPFETHLAASDSSSYLAAGMHLARSHRFGVEDPLSEQLPLLAKRQLFLSVRAHQLKPPFSRMPGGMVVEKLSSTTAHPSFLPLPSIWSAVVAEVAGPRLAGGFAPLFAGLALWGFWVFLRRRCGAAATLLATAWLGLSAAFYWSARFPLSEPLACFSLWAGLAALDGWEDEGSLADARLAALALGLTAVARTEYAAFVLAALAARYLLRAELGCRPLPRSFFAVYAAVLLAVMAEAAFLPGAYLTPISDALGGFQYLATQALRNHPYAAFGLVAALLALLVAALRRFGIARTLALAGLLAFVGAYVFVGELGQKPPASLSMQWLRAWLGLPLLALAAGGALLAWRERFRSPGNGFLLLLGGLVTVLLVYDPHVMTVMPWASRRFVPVVIPAAVALATLAIARLASRRLLAGLAVGLLALATSLAPASRLWGHPYYAGAWEQLSELAEIIPRDGTLLVESGLDNYVLGAPLWLIWSLNSLPVSVESRRSRNLIAGLTRRFSASGPVYLLAPTAKTEKIKIAFVIRRKLADYTFQFLMPEQLPVEVPSRRLLYAKSVSLFRLSPWKLPARRLPAKPKAAPPAATQRGQSRPGH